MFYLSKAAAQQMTPGGSIINTTSIHAQPAEQAPAYVFLASNEATYIRGLPVTGGKPFS